MTIPLIAKEDVISPGKKEKEDTKYRDGKYKKEKKEKTIRVLRIRFYEKISLPRAKDGMIEHTDAFAVDRSLEDLLKALYYDTGIQRNIAPPDCIFIEKDDRMGSNDKFIFVNIGTNEFYTLKRQLENHTTICAFNKGEFSILDGKVSSLSEMYRMPRIWKGADTFKREISDTNVILMREKLRKELKDELCPYHSYTDEQIDNMKESELISLKKLSSRKMAIENKKRKKARKLLR